MNKRRIIIDTDPGVDDALAIALACNAGLKIEALCTVFGNSTVDDTTENALAILSILGKNIKTYKGSAKPLRGKAKYATSHDEKGLGGLNIDKTIKYEETNAIDFYQQFLQKQPDNAITLVCIGPTTNIGKVFVKNPGLTKKVKEAIILAGVFGERGNISKYAEFNAYNDPDTLDYVLNLNIKKVLIPANVCRRVVFNEEVFNKVQGKITDQLKEVIGFYINYYKNDKEFGGFKGGVMYDLLAISYILKPEIFSVKKTGVKVVLTGERRGQTIVSNRFSNCELITKVDPVEIERLFISGLKAQNPVIPYN